MQCSDCTLGSWYGVMVTPRIHTLLLLQEDTLTMSFMLLRNFFRDRAAFYELFQRFCDYPNSTLFPYVLGPNCLDLNTMFATLNDSSVNRSL